MHTWTKIHLKINFIVPEILKDQNFEMNPEMNQNPSLDQNLNFSPLCCVIFPFMFTVNKKCSTDQFVFVSLTAEDKYA